MKITLLQSLRAKVVLMMIVLAIPLLTFIALFIVQMRIEAERFQRILIEDASIHKAAQETINAAQISSQALYKAVSVKDPRSLEDVLALGKVFQGAMINFELYMQALIYGSETEEFRTSKEGLNYQQWKRRGFDQKIIVARPSPLIRKKALDLEEYYLQYSRTGRVVMGNIRQALLLDLKQKPGEAETKREEAYRYLAELVETEALFQKRISDLINATRESTMQVNEVIEKSLNKRIHFLVLTGLTCFVIAIMMAWFFCNRYLIDTLQEMNTAVERIIHGNWNDKLAVRTRDEVGQLAQNFNRMLERLKSTLVSKDILLDEIKERKRAEQTMEKFKRRLEMILNSAGEGIFGIDLAGTVTFANPAAANLLRWKKDSLVGQNVWASVVNKPGVQREISSDKEHPITLSLEKGDERRVMDQSFFASDGAKIYVDYIVKPIYQDKNVTGAVVCFSDITERRALENQLMRSQKMESVGRLAGGIAHDFNNLLMVIRGNCDFLRSGLEQEDPRMEDIHEIQKATMRAIELTDHLLAFSRHQLTDLRCINLNNLIQKTVDVLKSTLGEGIEIRLKLDPELRFTETNSGQIEQVLLNLTLNAKDAMPEGGTFLIETFNQVVSSLVKGAHFGQLKPGNYVVLRLTDTGVGMNEEVKSRLFEPFFTTKKKRKGSGFGLATVYGIMKQNQSHIFVDSVENEGTTISLYFKASDVCKMDETPVRSEKASGSSVSLEGTETILLVEDEESLRKFVARGLKQMGYVVHEAANGAHALKQLEKIDIETVDLVLTDMVMPQMGGRELCEKVRQKRAGIKIVVMSGYTDDELINRYIKSAGIPFVQKPVAIEDLLRVIKSVLTEKEDEIKN